MVSEIKSTNSSAIAIERSAVISTHVRVSQSEIDNDRRLRILLLNIGSLYAVSHVLLPHFSVHAIVLKNVVIEWKAFNVKKIWFCIFHKVTCWSMWKIMMIISIYWKCYLYNTIALTRLFYLRNAIFIIYSVHIYIMLHMKEIY